MTKRTKSRAPLALDMASPCGSQVNLGPTILVCGSWAARPARTESSVEIAATWPCWSMARQSVQFGTATGMGSACALHFHAPVTRCPPWAMDLIEVVADVAQTGWPVSWPMLVTREVAGTSSRWPALK